MNNKRKKIIHFRESCIGCGSCCEYAPDNWTMNDADGKSCLKRAVQKDDVFIAEISDVELEANKFASLACPVGIIHVVDEHGKEL